MPKEIYRWKIPLIAILIALALVALYPPTNKVMRVEKIKEIDGKVVERETVEESWMAFLMGEPIRKEVIVEEEIDAEGKRVTKKVVEEIARGRVKLGLDLRGGSELIYRVRVAPDEDRPGITQEIIDVLKKRIDPRGIMEYRLQEQGFHRILIQVPGATHYEIEQLKERIVRLGKLEFRLAAPKGSAEYNDAMLGKPVPGYYKHWVWKKRGEVGELTEDWYLVRNRIELSGESLARVYPDRKNVQPVVGFEFNTEGKAKFSQLTERNIGKPLAIILDGILYSAPVIRERIPGRGIIEGNFTQDEVNNLLAIMRAGSLPADLELEMEMSVGPSLGRDSIKNGLIAGLVGGAFVVVFMGLYYLGAGLVANLALGLNIFLIVGTLALLGATLTLPGIAGLVLIVGMAVDANVLIFERIREEKNRGKAIPLALKTGYERAFTTIMDSNLTTLITALILYAVGTGPVKGFGIILAVGLIVNLFTAIFVTRVVFEVLDMKAFKMLQLFQRPHLELLNLFKMTAVVSAVIIILGLVVFKLRGTDKYDIDFTGGTLIHLQLANPTRTGTMRDALARAGYSDAEVQGIWGTATVAAAEALEFGIRIKGLSDEKITEKLENDIKKAFRDQFGNITVGASPTVLNLTLLSPLEESELRQRLAKIGYTDEDIVYLFPTGVSTQSFEITVPTLRDTGTRAETVELLSQGIPGLAFSEVSLSLGEMKEIAPRTIAPGAMPVAQGELELDLSKAVDPTLIELELQRRGFANVAVVIRGERVRKQVSSRLEIRGPKDTLMHIRAEMEKVVKLPAFTFQTDTSLRIELESPQEEQTLRDKLLGLGVTRVISLKAPSESFAMEVNPLSASKIQEKISEDVISTFKDNLFLERVEVSFEVLPETASVGESASRGQEGGSLGYKEEGESLVLMTLSKPMVKERIEDILSKSGYAGALEEALEPGKTYRSAKIRVKTSEIETMKVALSEAFTVAEPLKRIVSIGSTVAGEMKNRASLALIFALVAIIFYIWIRFGEVKFGVAAVFALVHDVLFTMGAVAVAGCYPAIFGDVKINLAMIASFLTLIGYSLNDTIVVFDRIRENMAGRKMVDAKLVNESINQTLNRTVITSITTLFVISCLYFLGGTEIHGFAFVMMVGVLVGTYSSIFVASPVLVHWSTVKKGFGIVFLILSAPLWALWKVLKWLLSGGGGTVRPRRA
ncbi:MAG: protein translocase subunit SecD [Candidatus Brocadiales bacterium]